MNISEMLNPQDSNAPPRKRSRQERREDSQVSAAAAAAVEPDSTKDGGPGGAAASGQSEAAAAGPDSKLNIEGVGLTFGQTNSPYKNVFFPHPQKFPKQILKCTCDSNNPSEAYLVKDRRSTLINRVWIGGTTNCIASTDHAKTTMSMPGNSLQDVNVSDADIPEYAIQILFDDCEHCRPSASRTASCKYKCGHIFLWFPNVGEVVPQIWLCKSNTERIRLDHCVDHNMTEVWRENPHSTFHVKYRSEELVFSYPVVTGHQMDPKSRKLKFTQTPRPQ